jgi:type II secretory pathway pseudopilin PulG
MFGLDARIALAVFGILAVVAGVAMVLNIDHARGQSLADELNQTGQAIEQMHNDLKEDVYQALISPSEQNAFQALYDNQMIQEADNLRSRWNGPYIKFISSLHPRYGDMTLQKHAADHTQSCEGADICYLYLVYSQVKPDIVRYTDQELDTEGVASQNSGRIQWEVSDERNWVLYYRVGRALTPQVGPTDAN